MTALTAFLFSKKKYAKMSVFYVKTVKIRWLLEVLPPDPVVVPLCQILGARAPLSWPTSNAVDYETFSTMFETQSIPTSIRCNLLHEKKLVNKNSKNTECQYRYLKLVQITGQRFLVLYFGMELKRTMHTEFSARLLFLCGCKVKYAPKNTTKTKEDTRNNKN